MFSKNYEQRLAAWRSFRNTLEDHTDPLQAVINFFKPVPIVRYQCDPYDRSTWPSPWELIQENTYCAFVKILAICYTLQLTDMFSKSAFEIHIKYSPAESKIYYLLHVDDRVIGYLEDTHVHKRELPNGLVSQQKFSMPSLQ
jgi:hypothetical protein